MAEERYLVTYGLVSNFYYNLVSWSKALNAVAIAVHKKAYWWDGRGGVEDMDLAPRTNLVICCVECSADMVAMAFENGLLRVFLAVGNRCMSRVFSCPILCVCWFPDGKRLLAGTLAGTVYIVEVGRRLGLLGWLGGLTQQVCGTYLRSFTIVFTIMFTNTHAIA